MIGAFIAGAIVGALFGSHTHRHTTHVIVKRSPNELIEYHKWLEEKQRHEEYEKAMRQRAAQIYELQHCSICGAEIKYEVLHVFNPRSYDNLVCVKIYCDCKDLNDIYKGQVAINESISNPDEIVYAEIRRLINAHKKYEKTISSNPAGDKTKDNNNANNH